MNYEDGLLTIDMTAYQLKAIDLEPANRQVLFFFSTS